MAARVIRASCVEGQQSARLDSMAIRFRLWGDHLGSDGNQIAVERSFTKNRIMSPFSTSPEQAIILIVEDSEDDIVLIHLAFRKSNLLNPVFAVRDGEEAIAYLKGEGK